MGFFVKHLYIFLIGLFLFSGGNESSLSRPTACGHKSISIRHMPEFDMNPSQCHTAFTPHGLFLVFNKTEVPNFWFQKLSTNRQVIMGDFTLPIVCEPV